MAIRFKTLRRDSRLENPAKPQRLRMSSEQAEAKRNPTVSNFTKKNDIVTNPVGLDGLPLSDYLILIGKRDVI